MPRILSTCQQACSQDSGTGPFAVKHRSNVVVDSSDRLGLTCLGRLRRQSVVLAGSPHSPATLCVRVCCWVLAVRSTTATVSVAVVRCGAVASPLLLCLVLPIPSAVTCSPSPRPYYSPSSRSGADHGGVGAIGTPVGGFGHGRQQRRAFLFQGRPIARGPGQRQRCHGKRRRCQQYHTVAIAL